MAGLSNADFARLFRQELRAEAATAAAATGDDGTDASPPAAGAGLGFFRAASEQRSAADEREAPAFARGGLGLGAQAPTPTPAPMQEQEASARPRAKPRAAWEKHTTGFGSKMLAKMGFSGRLGKKEDGVSAVLEVKLRPTQMGIGFGDFKEASTLTHNRKLQRELRGEEVGDEDRDQGGAAATKEDDSLWRRRKAVAGDKKKYKRAADLAREASAHKKKRSDVILDMRGPDVRVLSDVSSAYDGSARHIQDAKPKLGDELIYNVRMIVNSAEGKIYNLTQKIEVETESIKGMRKEAKIIRGQLDMDVVRLQHVQAMRNRLQQLEQIRENALESTSVEPILKHLSQVRRDFPAEFEAHQLVQLIPSLCFPPVRALLTEADLHDKKSVADVVDQFRRIQVFLLNIHKPEVENGEQRPIGVFPVIHERTNELAEDIYNFVLEKVLWPVMVHYVNVQWDPKRNPAECIDIYADFRAHLSPGFEDAFLYDLVLTRLKKECARWDPRTDSTPIHDWIFPWVSLLGKSLNPMFPEIRLAISSALNQWHPSDSSVLSVLSPWRDVWGEQEYAKFTHRHIVRKLIRCLQRDFVVDPQNQQLDALQWVLAWRGYLPERQFIALLEGEFFPNWLKTLRKWVIHGAELDELDEWYCGWKTFFERGQLASEPRFAVSFYSALVLLESALDLIDLGDIDRKGVVPDLNPLTPQSYQDALVAAKKDGSDEDEEPSRAPTSSTFNASSPRSVSHRVGLRDVVESLAIANNLTFMPKGTHDGQQLYAFGKHSILMEQGVVFVEGPKGVFKPVDVEQLL